MVPEQLLLRKEKGISFESSRKNYPHVDLPKWMKKEEFEQEPDSESPNP